MKINVTFRGFIVTLLTVTMLSTAANAAKGTKNKGSKNASEYSIGSKEGSDITFHQFLGSPKLDTEGKAELPTPYDAVLKGEVQGKPFEAVFTINAQKKRLNLNPNGLSCNGDKSLNIRNPGPITIEFKGFTTGEEQIQYTGLRTITLQAMSGVAKAKLNTDVKEIGVYATPKLGEEIVEISVNHAKKPISIVRVEKSFVVSQFSAKFILRKKKLNKSTTTPTTVAKQQSTPKTSNTAMNITASFSGNKLIWIAEDESNIKAYKIVKRGTTQLIQQIEPLGADEYSLELEDTAIDLLVDKLKGKRQRITPTK